MTARRGTTTRARSSRACPASGPSGGARGKVLSRSAAVAAVKRARRRGERIVFTNGCFDLLHVGHIRSLERARRLGDRLIVGVNTDTSVRRIKGPCRPIVPGKQRAEVVAALSCVDWVVLFGGSTPLALIRALRPDVLAKGGDWKINEIIGREDVESWGGRVVRLQQVPGVRTSGILSSVRRSSRQPSGSDS